MALFIKNRLTSSTAKQLWEIDNAHVICLRYNYISANKDSHDILLGFRKNVEALEIKFADKKQLRKKLVLEIFIRCFWFCRASTNC